MSTATPTPPRGALIAHVIFRFGVGGLENGLVNLLNHLPAERYRHVVIAMTEIGEIRARVARKDVEFVALGKRPGKDFGAYRRLWQLLRRLRPDIVHTRNIGTLDAHIAASLARTRRQVHGLHGWDVADLHGENRRYRILRRLCDPLIDRYIAVSHDLEKWLSDLLPRSARAKIVHVCNGVDTTLFAPGRDLDRETLLPRGFLPSGGVLFGWVGRMEAVKNPLLLLEAYRRLIASSPEARRRARLALVGTGPLFEEIHRCIATEDLGSHVWLPGARDDVAKMMRAMDVFVLPSLNEGISNTLLEAMASGLPLVATAVGGNPELIAGNCGVIVPSGDEKALSEAMAGYFADGARRRSHAAAARRRAEEHFSLARMIAGYARVYDDLIRAT